MDDQTYKDALLRKRVELLGTGGIKPLQASMDNNTRQGDMADQASGNNSPPLKPKQTDAKILQAIEKPLAHEAAPTACYTASRSRPRAERHPWTRSASPAGKSRTVTDVLPLPVLSREAIAAPAAPGLARSSGGDINNTYQ